MLVKEVFISKKCICHAVMPRRVPNDCILCIISYLFFSYYDNNNNNITSLVRFGFRFKFIAEDFREEKKVKLFTWQY